MNYKLTVLSHIIKENLSKLKWYGWKQVPFNVTAVAVVDGRFYSGGLTDRFKGIVSLFAWSQRRQIPFRIEYTYPFELTDYLVPNEYDWVVKDGDYVKAVGAADIIYSVGEPTVINRMSNKGLKRQVHFYGNRDLLDSMGFATEEWGCMFKKLFKPAERLRLSIEETKKNIGDGYFSVVLRFQNLLGDFPEYDFKPLESKQKQEELVITCLNQIERLIKRENGKKCLVTSDSKTFLELASDHKEIIIIPGDLVHMGSNTHGTYEQYKKSFLDFYMLSESTKIYNIVCGDMYPSGFPLYAAKVNNIPFERILIE